MIATEQATNHENINDCHNLVAVIIRKPGKNNRFPQNELRITRNQMKSNTALLIVVIRRKIIECHSTSYESQKIKRLTRASCKLRIKAIDCHCTGYKSRRIKPFATGYLVAINQGKANRLPQHELRITKIKRLPPPSCKSGKKKTIDCLSTSYRFSRKLKRLHPFHIILAVRV